MFAGLLNKGFRGGFLLVLIYFLVTLTISFFSTIELQQDLLPNLFYNYFGNKIESKWLAAIINFAFIGIGILTLGYISVEEEVVDKQNYFPTFLFLLISSAAINPFKLSPLVVTNVLILLAFYKLINTYRKDQVLKQLFDAGFLLGLTLFINTSGVLFLPVYFIGLFILRSNNWREWGVSLLGILVPFFIYECMAYLSNFNSWYLPETLSYYLSHFKKPSFSEYYLPLTVILFLLTWMTIFSTLTRNHSNTVKKQKVKTILFWFLILLIPGFFSDGANSSSTLLSFCIPACFLIGDFLFHLKQIKITNTILSFLLMACLIVFLGKLGVF